MNKSAKVLSLTLAGGSFALSRLLDFRVRRPPQSQLMMPKMMVESVAPYVGLMGAMGAAGGLLGLLSGARVAAVLSGTMGALGAAASARYMSRVLAARGDFDRAFGPGWEDRIPADMKSRMLQRRWTWRMPASPEPRWHRDVPFWTIPGREKPLLCDIWQPPAGTRPSGLAFLYFHGSEWHFLDKDFFTRPMFRHLAAQGHVVMDVAYRLCPEIDIHEMVGDVKRAVAWMKRNGSRYGVDRRKVVVAGGSAGGHIALLAAYTQGHPDFTPQELQDAGADAGADTSVLGVVSYYGPVDLVAMYDYLLQTMGTSEPEPDRASNPLANLGNMLTQKMLGSNGLAAITLPQIFTNLLGATPRQSPSAAELGSPANHVHRGCPPTLLLQGEYDAFVPVKSVQAFYDRLKEADVQSVYVELPQTEHAFDLIFARISPPGQVALYNTERFLALLATQVASKTGAAEQDAETSFKEMPYAPEAVAAGNLTDSPA